MNNSIQSISELLNLWNARLKKLGKTYVASLQKQFFSMEDFKDWNFLKILIFHRDNIIYFINVTVKSENRLRNYEKNAKSF